MNGFLPGFCGALLLVATLVLTYKYRRRIEKLLRHSYVVWAVWVWIRLHTRFLVMAFLLVAAFLALSGWLLYYSEAKLSSPGASNGLLSFIRSPGSVFAALMAVFTACGFFVTVTRIGEMGSRIIRYDDLLVRAARLLSDEVKLSRDESREVWMVGATPLHGNVSEVGTAYYEKYHKALEEARLKLTLHILHLPSEGLRKFYSRFAGNDSIGTAKVEEALNASIAFISNVSGEAHTRLMRIRQTARPDLREKLLGPHRLGHLLEEVGYRLLIAKDKAIFYVPLFLPPESNTPSPGTASQNRRKENARVEMLGFETEDRFVVEQLKTSFEFLARFSPQAGAESTDSVEVTAGHRINMSIMLPVNTQ